VPTKAPPRWGREATVV